MFSTAPKAFSRLAIIAAVCALALPGCSQFIAPDPLNKTESIVKGTQITRGPSRGANSSGFADTIAPTGSSFEPAVGEPFDVEQLVGIGENDAALPELGDIDFGAERGFVEQDALALSDAGAGTLSSTDTGSTAFFLSDIGQTVYFATDSSELDERARETLRRQAAWLNVNEQARVTIEGHADERGTREYNLALGDRRASATRGYLIGVGIDESRIEKISYGKERPVAIGSDTASWSQNRRTETTIDGGEAFASNPIGSSVGGFDAGGIDNLTLSSTGTVSNDPYGFDNAPLAIDTTDPFVSTPPAGTITYDSVPTVTQTFDSGTISPNVFDSTAFSTFDSGTVSSPPASTTTTTTRIEDVSVDDLLRDPSLIDRIGATPAPSN